MNEDMPTVLLILLALFGLLTLVGGLLLMHVDLTQGFRGGNDKDFDNHGHE